MTIPPTTDKRSTAQSPGPVATRDATDVPPRIGINWMRFWLQMLAAMMVFNIIAGLVTWYFIFPRLHPVH